MRKNINKCVEVIKRRKMNELNRKYEMGPSKNV